MDKEYGGDFAIIGEEDADPISVEAPKGIDTGTAYGLKAPTYRKALVETGAGTPMGELLRRYWQPVYASADLSSDDPVRVKILGEELVLFRDKTGKPGLVAEHCCHRGASLYYGRIEEDGIRCCYHGWKFDVEGNCLHQACELGGGKRLELFRQPWYPVQERYGLIYAYMGPPEKKPVLPRWEHLEDLASDEFIEVSMYPGYGPKEEGKWFGIMDYNWLQSFENVIDPCHALWLHFNHSSPQFLFSNKDIDQQQEALGFNGVVPYENMVAAFGIEQSDWGVKNNTMIPGPDGTLLSMCVEALMPNAGVVPGFDDMLYFVPVDDTHHLLIQVGRVTRKGEMLERRQTHDNGRDWWELSEAELQRHPGDYEAQSSQGSVPPHSLEHLAQSDRGVVLIRRRLLAMLKQIERGEDPLGVSFDENEKPRRIDAHAARPFSSQA